MVYKTIILVLLGVISLSAQVMLNPDRANTINPPSGSEPETGEIFADNFEDGTLDAWTANNEGSNTITIATDTVNSGTYSALFDWAGVDNVNTIDISVDNLESIYFRMYQYNGNDINSDPNHTNYFCVVAFWDGGTEVVRIFMITSGTPDYVFDHWLLWMRNDNYRHADDDLGVVVNDWARVELGWEKNGSSAWAEIRVDGDSVYSTVEIDHSVYFIDKITVGTYTTHIPQTESYYYIDDVVIDSSGWVGAKP